jgi:hypothetical protein
MFRTHANLMILDLWLPFGDKTKIMTDEQDTVAR